MKRNRKEFSQRKYTRKKKQQKIKIKNGKQQKHKIYIKYKRQGEIWAREQKQQQHKKTFPRANRMKKNQKKKTLFQFF